MRVLVLGGGISGIATSYYLQQAGIEPVLIESGPRLGGRLGFGALGDRGVAFGGKNIGSRYTEFRAFCKALGVSDFEYFGINTSRVENGRLVSINRDKPLQTLRNLVANNRWQDLLQFAVLATRVKRRPRDGFADSRYFGERAKAKGDPVLSQVFGEQLVREMVRPMVVRMNGAEPDEAYLSSFGSNLRVLLDSYDQLTSGMEGLIARFAATTTVHLRTRVESLVIDDGRVRGVVVTDENGAKKTLRADAVCMALPAPDAASLVELHARDLAASLREVRYFPVRVVIAEYARDIFSPEIRAVLFDERCVISNAGCYGAEDLKTIRYTFSGRLARALIAEGASDEALLARAEEALNPYVPVQKNDRVRFASRTFDPGLCAFSRDTRGLNQRLDAQSSLLGLSFTGDYRKGASIEACFAAAKECALHVAKAEGRKSMPSPEATRSIVSQLQGRLRSVLATIQRVEA